MRTQLLPEALTAIFLCSYYASESQRCCTALSGSGDDANTYSPQLVLNTSLVTMTTATVSWSVVSDPSQAISRSRFNYYYDLDVNKDGTTIWDQRFVAETQSYSATITQLCPGITYSVQVASAVYNTWSRCCSWGCSCSCSWSWSEPIIFQTAPFPPVLNTINVSDTSIWLKWKHVQGASSYRIQTYEYEKTEPAFVSETTNNTFEVQHLLPSKQYNFTVTAKTRSGTESNKSRSVFKAAEPLDPGECSIRIQLVSRTTNSINITWNDLEVGSYDVKYHLSSSDYFENKTVDTTFFNVDGLVAGTMYTFHLYLAADKVECFPESNFQTVPEKVEILEVERKYITVDSVTLKWKKANGTSIYTVRFTDEKANEIHPNVCAESEGVKVNHLEAGTMYLITVAAVGESREVMGEWSDPKTVITLPAIPQLLLPIEKTNTTLTFKWNYAAGAIEYLLKISADTYKNFSWINDSRTGETSFTFEHLTPGTFYNVNIYSAARNRTINEQSSSISYVQTVTAIPGRPKITGKTSKSLKIKWNAVHGAYKYKVSLQRCVSGTSDIGWFVINTSVSRYTISYEFQDLMPGTCYCINVQSVGYRHELYSESTSLPSETAKAQTDSLTAFPVTVETTTSDNDSSTVLTATTETTTSVEDGTPTIYLTSSAATVTSSGVKGSSMALTTTTELATSAENSSMTLTTTTEPTTSATDSTATAETTTSIKVSTIPDKTSWTSFTSSAATDHVKVPTTPNRSSLINLTSSTATATWNAVKDSSAALTTTAVTTTLIRGGLNMAIAIVNKLKEESSKALRSTAQPGKKTEVLHTNLTSLKDMEKPLFQWDESRTSVGEIAVGKTPKDTSARVVVVGDINNNIPIFVAIVTQLYGPTVSVWKAEDLLGNELISISSYAGATTDEIPVLELRIAFDVSNETAKEDFREWALLEVLSLPSSSRAYFTSVKPECVFFNLSAKEWSKAGCRSEERGDFLDCHCNHATSFAVMMSANVVAVPLGVKVVSYVTEVTSLLFLLAAIVALASVRIRAQRDRIKVQICLLSSLFLLHALSVLQDLALQNRAACEAWAVLMHYFLLCSAMWMLMEGLTLLFKTMDNVMWLLSGQNEKKFAVFRYVVSFSVPAVIVTTSAAVGFTDTTRDYMPKDPVGKYQHCWVGQNMLLGAVIVPVSCVLLCSLLISVRMFYVVYQMSAEAEKFKPSTQRSGKSYGGIESLEHFKAGLKSTLILLPALGIPWFLGFFTGVENGGVRIAFMYLNVIVNGLQGVMLFVIYCVVNKEVRKAIRGIYNQKKNNLPGFSQPLSSGVQVMHPVISSSQATPSTAVIQQQSSDTDINPDPLIANVEICTDKL